LDTISTPLLDRCEIIQLSGYTYDEKLNITTRFLLPKQIEANALTNARLEITDLALTSIVTKYVEIHSRGGLNEH
jgi:ATP-dependent Lon protease